MKSSCVLGHGPRTRGERYRKVGPKECRMRCDSTGPEMAITRMKYRRALKCPVGFYLALSFHNQHWGMKALLNIMTFTTEVFLVLLKSFEFFKKCGFQLTTASPCVQSVVLGTLCVRSEMQK